MNNLILKPLIVFLSLQVIISAQSFWKPAAPLPPVMRAFSTSVIGNKAYFWCESGQIYSTDGGGNSFTFYPWYTPFDNTTFGESAPSGIAFADSLIGYITDSIRGEFRTTDGGSHWIKMDSTYTGAHMVKFANTKVGFKIGGLGLHKTTDAGRTWTLFQTGFPFDGQDRNLYVMDELNLWVLKDRGYATNAGAAIWHCSNGSSKWSRLNTGIESDSLNEVVYSDFHMNPSGIGYVVGRIYRPQQQKNYGLILKTKDFGKTWTTQEFPDELYFKLETVNDSTCVVFGYFPGYNEDKICFRRTGNMGQSWERGNISETRNNYSTFYTSADVPSLNTILVSSFAGMYKSTDAGLSFTRVSSNSDAYVHNVSFDNKPQSPETQLAAAVSYSYSDKNFIVSRDGGRTWTQKHFPKSFKPDLAHISIAGGCMYMTEGQYRLYKSTDYGDSWKEVYLRRYGAISGLYALSPDTLVAQAYPNLCTTTDGGTNWKYAPLQDIFLKDIKVYSGLHVWGTGGLDINHSRAGIIYSSTDGGNNFRVQDISPFELTQVEFIDELTGFALGERQLYATRDGGNSWSHINTDAIAFAFYDNNRGVILTSSALAPSSSLVTSDAGRTWKKGNFNFNSLEAKLFFNQRGDLFASSRSALYIYPDALSQIPLPQKEFTPEETLLRFTRTIRILLIRQLLYGMKFLQGCMLN